MKKIIILLVCLPLWCAEVESAAKKTVKPKPFRYWFSSYQNATAKNASKSGGFSLYGSTKIFPSRQSRSARIDNSVSFTYNVPSLSKDYQKESKALNFNTDCLYFIGKGIHVGLGGTWIYSENSNSQDLKFLHKVTLIHEKSFRKKDRYYLRGSAYNLLGSVSPAQEKTYNFYGRYEHVLNDRVVIRVESDNTFRPLLKNSPQRLTTKILAGLAYRL